MYRQIDCVSRARMQSVKVRANNAGRASISARFLPQGAREDMRRNATLRTIYDNKLRGEKRQTARAAIYNDRSAKIINRLPFLALVLARACSLELQSDQNRWRA